MGNEKKGFENTEQELGKEINEEVNDTKTLVSYDVEKEKNNDVKAVKTVNEKVEDEEGELSASETLIDDEDERDTERKPSATETLVSDDSEKELDDDFYDTESFVSAVDDGINEEKDTEALLDDDFYDAVGSISAVDKDGGIVNDNDRKDEIEEKTKQQEIVNSMSNADDLEKEKIPKEFTAYEISLLQNALSKTYETKKKMARGKVNEVILKELKENLNSDKIDEALETFTRKEIENNREKTRMGIFVNNKHIELKEEIKKVGMEVLNFSDVVKLYENELKEYEGKYGRIHDMILKRQGFEVDTVKHKEHELVEIKPTMVLDDNELEARRKELEEKKRIQDERIKGEEKEQREQKEGKKNKEKEDLTRIKKYMAENGLEFPEEKSKFSKVWGIIKWNLYERYDLAKKFGETVSKILSIPLDIKNRIVDIKNNILKDRKEREIISVLNNTDKMLAKDKKNDDLIRERINVQKLYYKYIMFRDISVGGFSNYSEVKKVINKNIDHELKQIKKNVNEIRKDKKSIGAQKDVQQQKGVYKEVPIQVEIRSDIVKEVKVDDFSNKKTVPQEISNDSKKREKSLDR